MSRDGLVESAPNFQKDIRGVSAPLNGRNTADYSHDRASVCTNCGNVGHEHDKVRVYDGEGPAGTYHYRYLCPEGSR